VKRRVLNVEKASRLEAVLREGLSVSRDEALALVTRGAV
jgi:hypothetical protein